MRPVSGRRSFLTDHDPVLHPSFPSLLPDPRSRFASDVEQDCSQRVPDCD